MGAVTESHGSGGGALCEGGAPAGVKGSPAVASVAPAQGRTALCDSDRGSRGGVAAGGYDTPDRIFARAMGLEDADVIPSSSLALAGRVPRPGSGGRLGKALACLLPGRKDAVPDLGAGGEDDDGKRTRPAGWSRVPTDRRKEEQAGSRAVTWYDGDTTEEELAAAGVKTGGGSRSAPGRTKLRSAEKAGPGARNAKDRVGSPQNHDSDILLMRYR